MHSLRLSSHIDLSNNHREMTRINFVELNREGINSPVDSKY